MRKLDVYMNGHKAGVLTERLRGKSYSFRYEEDYFCSRYPAISVNLPKRKETYESDGLFPVFANILPEGLNRKFICRACGIDETDLFGVLSAMANADFIGAIEIQE